MMRADAIVVLGCRIGTSGGLPPAASRRAQTAARAYLEGAAPIVIASGGRRWGAHVEAKSLWRELVRSGVPSSAIVQELWSLSTYENAVFAAALLKQLRAERTIVVTCGWHLERALQNFRAAGVDAVGLPAPEPGGASALVRVERAVHEFLSGLFDARAIRRADIYQRIGVPTGLGPRAAGASGEVWPS
jgi:uncharacterized SAM-binding protein YcdF (DUF218 family)